ncbi:DUF3999 family protein [Sphingomonas arenae]|uniref:DUF3999 family protein n=1 Tax=Sphingomonas arenae TaxID=2812555 RepID=UPI00196815AE|nr:DUF3999 family protein [Sphingomonas arenae]
MRALAAFTLLLVVVASGCRQAPAVDVSKPEAYARQAALEPAPGGKLQRVTLPPALLAAAERRDLGDVRVFDARGRLVALAMLPVAAGAEGSRRVDLPVYPVLGGNEALQNSRLTIRVEDGGAAQAITVDQSARSAGGKRMPAVLLDSRAVREPVDAIALRVDVPVGRPVPLTLLTSSNLKDWEPLTEKVLFRPNERAPLLGGARVALDGADLRGRFVGVSWTEPGSIAVKGASAILAAPPGARRVAVRAESPALTDAHQLQFELPANGRLAAIRVTPAAADGIVPVRLYGRSPGRDAWTALGSATLSGEGGAGIIALPDVRMASYKLEADGRTAGFSTAPEVELLFDPVELLVAFSGTPPYRIAVGQAAAKPNFLTLAEIDPSGAPLNVGALPRATVDGASDAPPAIPLQGKAAGGMEDMRKPFLWAALLIGTLVLAFAAFRLLRASNAGSRSPA